MPIFILCLLFAMLPAAVAYGQAKSLTYCAYDYMANCSDYSITSEAAKRCMADVGIDLSPNCVKALIEDGFVTKKQVIDFAAKKGITVVDTPDGLKKVTKKPDEVIVKEIPPKETATPVEVIIPKTQPVEDIPSKKVTTEPIAPLPGEVTPSTQAQYEEPIPEPKPTLSQRVKKTYTTVKEKVKKAFTPKKTEKKVAQKPDTPKAKMTYKTPKANRNDWKLPNTKYAKLPRIKEQNKLRRQASQRDIVSDGINADFGRYTSRPKGYTRKKFKYSWKKHMEDHAIGMIRSGGINAQF